MNWYLKKLFIKYPPSPLFECMFLSFLLCVENVCMFPERKKKEEEKKTRKKEKQKNGKIETMGENEKYKKRQHHKIRTRFVLQGSSRHEFEY